MRSTSQPYEVLGRRADGRGTVRLANYDQPGHAWAQCQGLFLTDHSLTMCWVRHKHSNAVHGEVLTRDPPGLNDETEKDAEHG